MKKLTLGFSIAFLMLWISYLSFSQVPKSREDKKATKEVQRDQEYQALGTLLDTKRIAYQTERVQASTGIKIYNLVQIDGSGFYIRCENPPNTSGRFSGARDNTTPNNSPQTGLFFEGYIENWQLTSSPKKYYVINFNAVDKEGVPWGEIMIKAYTNKSAAIEIKSRFGHMIFSNYTGKVRPL